jgi:hypothetical protein
MIRHSHGSSCGRLSEFLCDVAVSPRLPVWNLQQLTPDGHLKGCPLEIQRKIEMCPAGLEVFLDLPDENLVRSLIKYAVMWNLPSEKDRNESLFG